MLFLDELPEFKRSVLETMRQPLEEGRVTISRAAGTMTFAQSEVSAAKIGEGSTCTGAVIDFAGNHPLKPSAELLEAYAKADAAHFAKKAKRAKPGTAHLPSDLPDATTMGICAILLTAIVVAIRFFWLLATAIAACPSLQ